MIVITGRRSAITQALLEMLPEDETPVFNFGASPPLDAERYFFCAGVLKGQRIQAMQEWDAHETFDANFIWPAQMCDEILASNPKARICVMGSMSGIKGSYDAAYAGSKAALHCYVQHTRLTYPGQQLVAIAPGVIEGTGMTLQRRDLAETTLRLRNSRRGRGLTPVEVARMAHFLLYVDEGAVTNTVVEMGGGL